MRFIIDNFADTSLLSVNPVVTGDMSVSNLLSNSRAKIFRTNAQGEVDKTQDILGNLLPPVDVSAVVLGRHNFPVDTTVTISLYSGFDQTTLVNSYGPTTISSTDKTDYVQWITPADANIKSFKISIVLATSIEVDIGRLIIGNYLEPTYTIDKGYSLTLVEDTKQYRTEGGSLRSDLGIPYKKLTFDISTVKETDRVLIQNNLRRVGMHKDFYISLFPEDTTNKERDYSGIFKLTKIPIFSEFINNYYKSKYEMEEI